MDELLELRNYIEQQRYPEALNLLAELEEMSRDDKINKIYSFTEILLLHLVKQTAEKRTTRSWDLSIQNAICQIWRSNQRHKSKKYYLDNEELHEIVTKSYPNALKYAALEAFGGVYETKQLAQMVDRATIEQQAMTLIETYREED